MFKIAIILALVYCISIADLTDSKTQQQFDNDVTHKREARQAGHCSLNTNQNKDLPGYMPPVIESAQPVIESSQKNVPNIDSSADLRNARNEDKMPTYVYPNSNLQSRFDYNQVKPGGQVKQIGEEYVPNSPQNTQVRQNPEQPQLGYPIQINNNYPMTYPLNYENFNRQDTSTDAQEVLQTDIYNTNRRKINVESKVTENDYKSNSPAEPKIEDDSEHDLGHNCQFAQSRRANNEIEDNPSEVSNSIDDRSAQVSEDSLPKKARYNIAPRRNKLGYYNNQLGDPTTGSGVTAVVAGGVNLLEHNRVCYACTSATNPTCLQPDRRTTVKYCLKGHEACVTKTYQPGNDKDSLVLIRDCGVSCDDTDIPGPPYKSCKVCHTDLCNDEPNGALTIKSSSIILTACIIFVIKYAI